MSSGTGFGGFGHRGRTATVASAIEVGRMFLRDIFAAPRIVAEAAAELANPAHARTRQRSSLTLPTAALGNPDHAISSTARTVRISRQMRLPATGSTLNGRSHPVAQLANATPASVWQDEVSMPANRSSQSRLASRSRHLVNRSHGLALGEGMRRTLPQRPKPLSDRCVPRVRRRSPQARREHGRRQTPRAGGTRANR